MSAVDREDFVVFVWEAGSDSGASGAGTRNAPGCSLAAWNTASQDSSVFMDSNGGPLIDALSCTVDSDGGNIRFTNASSFGSAVVGMFVYIENYVGTDLSVGDDTWYMVQSRTDNSITLSGESWSDGSAGDVSLGGAADGLQDLIANQADLVDATAFNGDYLIKGDETITATLVPVNGGSLTGMMNFIGIEDLSDIWTNNGTRVVITTATDLTVGGLGLVAFASGITFVQFENIDFNGVGTNFALYCLYNNSDVEGDIAFYNCLIHDAESNGAHIGGTSAVLDVFSFIGCDIYDNGGRGISGRSTSRGVFNVIECSVHDNDSDGIGAVSAISVKGCQIYGNGGSGIYRTGTNSSQCAWVENTIYNNDVDGIKLLTATRGYTIINNTCSENDGFGYNLAGLTMGAINTFANNHSKNNDADGTPDSGPSHCSETSTLALFEVFGQGNNFSGNAAFTNVGVGTEDFRPGSTSVLIDAGAGGTGDTVGALSAAAGGGGAVWPQNIERHGD